MPRLINKNALCAIKFKSELAKQDRDRREEAALWLKCCICGRKYYGYKTLKEAGYFDLRPHEKLWLVSGKLHFICETCYDLENFKKLLEVQKNAGGEIWL